MRKENVNKTVEADVGFVTSINQPITRLEIDYGREDLNLLRDKLNEVIESIKQ